MNADKELVTSGLACVDLTPDMKKSHFGHRGNEILKVINDDPGIPDEVPAWCGLTGVHYWMCQK